MYLKCHTLKPSIPPNNLNKGKHHENVSVYYRAFNIDWKASITALKSVITSPKFTNFVTIGDKNN